MRKLSLTLLALTFMLNGYAQVKTQIVTIDLSNPTTRTLSIKRENLKNTSTSNEFVDVNKLVLPNRQLMVFEIKNGNPFKYNYSINHKTVNFYEDVSFDWSNFKAVEGFGKKQKTEDSGAGIDSVITNMKALKQEYTSALEFKKNQYVKALSEKSIFDKEEKQLNEKIASTEKKIAQLKSMKSYQSKSIYSANFLNNEDLAKLTATQKVNYGYSADEDETNISKAIEAQGKSLKTLHDEISSYLVGISAEDFLAEQEFTKNRLKYKEIYGRLQVDLEEIGKEASNFPNTFNKFIEKKKDIDIVSNNIKKELGKMYAVKLHHYTLPIDIYGQNIDLLEITLQRATKKESTAQPEKYTYNFWISGGLKIDVSAGAVITSVKSKTYQTEDKTVSVNGQDETHKIIYEDKSGKYDFGFGSLINITPRLGGSWLRPTINVGAVLTADEKFQFLGGAGIIFGKKERVVLHGGFSMGSVSTIAKNYIADGSEAYNLGTSGAVPTTNKFTFGHYIGFTYNFGKVKTAEETKK